MGIPTGQLEAKSAAAVTAGESEDTAGPAIQASGLTAALQPTHCTAQPLLTLYTNANRY